MMSMCPVCYELYSSFWSKPMCDCGCKNVPVSVELVFIVQLLLNRGFTIISANCNTYDNPMGKSTHMQIDFGYEYPESLFQGLPPDWLIGAYHLTSNNFILQPPLTMLSCICRHPTSEADDLSISFDKLIIISNLEVWLENIDPKSCKSLLTLYGYPTGPIKPY